MSKRTKTILFIVGLLIFVPPTLVFAYTFDPGGGLGLATLIFWWAVLTWLGRRLGIVEPCGCGGACSIEPRSEEPSEQASSK